MKLTKLFVLPASLLVLLAFIAVPARADVIDWTTWTAGTSGSPGSASGTIGALTVTYSGQTSGLSIDYPSWGPSTTYVGGVVGNAPPAADNAVAMEGGVLYTETITFSQVVADPILAIWSLGAGGIPAYFDFTSGEPFNLVAGGPSNEYGGGAIVLSGESIFGEEGNGVVQFVGDYSSITFTTPNLENYYAFTIGEDQTLTSQLPPPNSGPTPEPGSLALLGTGLAALPYLRSRFAR